VGNCGPDSGATRVIFSDSSDCFEDAITVQVDFTNTTADKSRAEAKIGKPTVAAVTEVKHDVTCG
jgi:hypothetical protein